jgi:DNA-binding LacI/PurR family transcriptional regulator
MILQKEKYSYIYDSLRKDIVSGRYKGKLPPDKVLAESFGVSRPTVAKALSELQQEQLVNRRAGAGTFVRFQPAANEAKTLGLLIPELGETEIFGPICSQIAYIAKTNYFNLLWGGSGNNRDEHIRREEARQLAERYVAQRIAGVFFVPQPLISEHDDLNQIITNSFDKEGIAVVLLDRDIVNFPERSKYDVVGIDNFRASCVLTQHLLHCGCKNIRFIAKPRLSSTVSLRKDGYCKAIAEAGITYGAPHTHFVDVNDKGLIIGLMDKNKDTDGIICANDDIAAIIIQHLTASGYKIPETIQVTGFDDVKYARLLHIPLTTYHQPCTDIGTVAMDLMSSRLNNPTLPPRSVCLDGKIVVRNTTMPQGQMVTQRQ